MAAIIARTKAEHAALALAGLAHYKASALKSYGEYKPVMIREDGTKTILGQNAKTTRIQPLTKFYSGPSEVTIHRRGKTFPTRQEAVDFAESYIEGLRESFRKLL